MRVEDEGYGHAVQDVARIWLWKHFAKPAVNNSSSVVTAIYKLRKSRKERELIHRTVEQKTHICPLYKPVHPIY